MMVMIIIVIRINILCRKKLDPEKFIGHHVVIYIWKIFSRKFVFTLNLLMIFELINYNVKKNKRKSNLKCLEKTSEESFFTYTSPLDDYLDQRLPGEQYNINQQCQLALGNQYQSYISKRSPFNVTKKKKILFYHFLLK